MGYIYEDQDIGGPQYLEGLTTPLSAVLEEQFAMSMEENPIRSVTRFYDLMRDKQTGPKIPAEEVTRQLRDAQLSGLIEVPNDGLTQAALDTLMYRKRVEVNRFEIFERSKGGIVQGAARLGVALGASFTDPVNVGFNFIPVVGQARYAKWLESTKGAWGRLGVRAGAGAIEGVVGAAVLEPVIATSRHYEQAEYGAVDSLMNVAFGTVFGASTHMLVGTAKELFQGLKFFEPRAEPTPEPPPKFTVRKLSELDPAFLASEKERLNNLDVQTPDEAVRIMGRDFLMNALDGVGTDSYVALNSAGQIAAAASVTIPSDGGIAQGHWLGAVEPMAGRALLKQLFQLARERNIPAARFSSSAVAERFYDRLGAESTGGGDRTFYFNPHYREYNELLESISDTLYRDNRAEIFTPEFRDLLYHLRANFTEGDLATLREIQGEYERVRDSNLLLTRIKEKFGGRLPSRLSVPDSTRLEDMVGPDAVEPRTLREIEEHLMTQAELSDQAYQLLDDVISIVESDDPQVPHWEELRAALSDAATPPVRMADFTNLENALARYQGNNNFSAFYTYLIHRFLTGDDRIDPVALEEYFSAEAPEPIPDATGNRAMETQDRNAHIERTREAVGQAVMGEPVNVVQPPVLSRRAMLTGLLPADITPEPRPTPALEDTAIDTRVVEGTAQRDTDIPLAHREAELVQDTVPEDPVEGIDESLSTAESELKATEDRIGDPEDIDPEIVAVDEGAQRAEEWARATEIATNCLLRNL